MNNQPDQGKVFSAEEVLRRNMSVAFDDEANQPFLAEMIKCMELYANHNQYKEITLPSQPVKEVSIPTALTDEYLMEEAEMLFPYPSEYSFRAICRMRQIHIADRKMSLQLTQQERRDIAEKAWIAANSYDVDGEKYPHKQKYLDQTYPLTTQTDKQ